MSEKAKTFDILSFFTSAAFVQRFGDRLPWLWSCPGSAAGDFVGGTGPQVPQICTEQRTNERRGLAWRGQACFCAPPALLSTPGKVSEGCQTWKKHLKRHGFLLPRLLYNFLAIACLGFRGAPGIQNGIFLAAWDQRSHTFAQSGTGMSGRTWLGAVRLVFARLRPQTGAF